jgi:integrase
MIAAAPERFRAANALGACGMRVREVIGTTVEQIDLEHRTLDVDRQLVRIVGRHLSKRLKREKTRTIELPGWALLELRRHLRDHGRSGNCAATRPRASCCSGATGTHPRR